MMRSPSLRATSRSRLPLPRPTARLRLTALYSALFLLSSATLLAITYLLVEKVTKHAKLPFAPLRTGTPPVPTHPGPVQQLQAAAAHQQNAWDLNQLLIQSGIALVIVAVLAIVLGWLIAGRILRPLSTITAAARRISASSLHERLALHGPDDELKDLGDTLDDLFARLEASFHAQRHFIANASHELRTPITRERTLLQVALANPATTTGRWQDTAREVLASNAGQEHLIDALLTLASGESALDHREPIDLSAVTGAVLLARRSQIRRKRLRIKTTTRPAALDGDPLLVERLVANLIDNAVRHNVADGHVEISTGTRYGCAVLSVASTGPVISPAEVDRLFHPFQRLNGHRGHHKDGHGLGLSIIQAIATAHGATVTAQAPPDGGLTIDVTFTPAASATVSN